MNNLNEAEVRTVLAFLAEHKEHAPSGCLEWQRTLSPKGYGRMWISGREARAHRAVWIAVNGPIPAGILVCHHCDNRRCIEPAHLFLGSNDENMADMVAKQRQPLGTRNGLSKLSDDAVREIYTSPEPTKVLVARYGVSVTTICDIRRGDIWAQVTKDLPAIKRAHSPAAKEAE